MGVEGMSRRNEEQNDPDFAWNGSVSPLCLARHCNDGCTLGILRRRGPIRLVFVWRVGAMISVFPPKLEPGGRAQNDLSFSVVDSFISPSHVGSTFLSWT
jgi:hypothetical protein